MSVFGKYSRYYDLLYRDKDYAGEADFVAGLIERYRPGARRILELGCGSGTHAALLAARGYTLHGVDVSQAMLDEAQARLTQLPRETAARLAFSHGDVRTTRVGEKFDVVISLFHVVSYQPANADLAAMFQTVREHLDSEGVFVFDCWYGPAVLTDRPMVRVKRMQDDEIDITRVAEPAWYPNENRVDVNYQVLIRERAGGAVEELRETHRMRYLFLPEVDMLATAAGLRVEHAAEWMTNKPLGADTWGACFVLQR